MPDTPSAHDATLALLRALIGEIKSAAHDPQLVHAAAAKLKDGIDALERALTQVPKTQAQEQKIEKK